MKRMNNVPKSINLVRNNLIIIFFNAQGNLLSCADNIRFYSELIIIIVLLWNKNKNAVEVSRDHQMSNLSNLLNLPFQTLVREINNLFANG